MMKVVKFEWNTSTIAQANKIRVVNYDDVACFDENDINVWYTRAQ